ncbi:MAG TPA: hypothetical protein VLY03_03825 [Bacteroidota bacterium]|nr:hypothetical protein [Bacteroidota bacterium]
MYMQVIAILVFGLTGYFLGSIKKDKISNRFNIILLILLLFAANSHGLGFSGVGEFVMKDNDILQGLIFGILLRRISFKPSLAI